LSDKAAQFSGIYAVAAGAAGAGAAAGASSFLGSTTGSAVGSAGAGAKYQLAREILISSIFQI